MPKKKVEPLLCTSVAAASLREMERKASLALSLGSDLVEFRVDHLSPRPISPQELESRLASFAERAVMTVRPSSEGGNFNGDETARLELVSRLAEMRPAFIDVELSAMEKNRQWAGSLPQGVKKIVSWHDFQGTPPLKALQSISTRELGFGGLAKVVTTAGKVDDNLTTLALCADEPGKIVSFCMGALGGISRVLSMCLGAPIAYASIPDEAIAPGQLSVSTMGKLRRMVDRQR